MPFKQTLNQLKNKFDEYNRQHNILPGSQSSNQQGPPQHQQYFPATGQQYQQQQQPSYAPPPPEWNRPPPPIPQYSHPSPQQQAPQQPVNRIYWQARFDPSTPISQEWEQKLGNSDGWGNNELEYYTANPENAFYTGDHKLILRAISNNSAPNPEGKFTSARLVSRQTLARPRGVITAFLSSPCAAGIWPAFWLLPREPFQWPSEGEIDIAETWNSDHNNKSCLHWGTYTPEDAGKHRVMGTQINDMSQRAVRYDFAWNQDSGRLMWYIDGRPVMKAMVPQGTRPLHDWCVILNVAMGGNVCAGQIPKNGAYDLIVHALYMSEEPEHGGWQQFDGSWNQCPDGNPM